MTVIGSGLSIGAVGRCYGGPFLDGNGNIYALLRDSFTLRMFKSANGGSTWTEQDSGNSPTVGVSIPWHIWQSGTALHMARQSSDGGVSIYTRFNTSDAASSQDTWVDTGTTVHLPLSASNIGFVDIVVRPSADRIIVHSTDVEKIHGTDYNRIGVSEFVSSWSQIAIIGTGTQANFGPASLAVDSAGKVHIAYARSNQSSGVFHVSLADGSSTPSSEEAVNDNGATIDVNTFIPSGAYRSISGNEVIMFVWKRASNNQLVGATITNDGTPDAEFNISDNAVEYGTSIFTEGVFAATGHPTSARWIATYSHDTDLDIYFDQNSGAGFGTDVEALDAITANRATYNIYSRGGNYVLGILYHDGSNVHYEEYVLASLTPATSLVIPRIQDRIFINLRR